MPVTFALLPDYASKQQVGRYRAAVVLALGVCYLLNIGWVVAVLQVVPREAAAGEMSLAVAFDDGLISTVPLIETLAKGGKVKEGVLGVVEGFVEMFIFVSTGVSYFVVAAGTKSFVDGVAGNLDIVFPGIEERGWLGRAVCYVGSFGSVLYIIIANPKGFIQVLTRFTSFTLNLQAGVLLFVMLYFSRRKHGVMEGEEEDGDGGESGNGKNGFKKIIGEIALSMSNVEAYGWMIFGVIFFSVACGLAMIGPFLGINVGGRE